MHGHSAHALVLSLLLGLLASLFLTPCWLGLSLRSCKIFLCKAWALEFPFRVRSSLCRFYRWDLSALCMIPVSFIFGFCPHGVHCYYFILCPPCVHPLLSLGICPPRVDFPFYFCWVLFSRCMFYYFYLSLCAVLTVRFYYRPDSTYPHLTSSDVVDCSTFISSLRIQISDIYLTLEVTNRWGGTAFPPYGA